MFVYPYATHQDVWQKSPVKDYLQLILSRGAKVAIVLTNRRIALRGDMAVIGTEQEFADLLL
jgi:hypothetical protein